MIEFRSGFEISEEVDADCELEFYTNGDFGWFNKEEAKRLIKILENAFNFKKEK